MFGRRGCLGKLISLAVFALVAVVGVAFLSGLLEDDDDYISYDGDDFFSDYYYYDDDYDYDYISYDEIQEGNEELSLDDLIDAFFDYYGYFPEDSGSYNFFDDDDYSGYSNSHYSNDTDYDTFYTGSGSSGDSAISQEPASTLAQRFIDCAKKWLGTPYVFGGTSRSGIDCSGLIYMAAQEAGLGKLPRNSRSMYSICTPIKKSELRPGDLVFFAASTSITHVSLYVGNGQLLHAISEGSKTGVCYSKMTDSYWKDHYYSSGRIISDDITEKRSEARNLANARARAANTAANENSRD